LLVVLALLALMAGVAVPLTWRQIDAARARDATRTIEAIVSALPAEAFRQGKALEVDAAALQARMPGWPAGWKLTVSPPLRYGPDGVAQGAAITVLTPTGAAMRWRVEPYTGALKGEGSH
jgi:type II secretory pathway pseudopilin PulG